MNAKRIRSALLALLLTLIIIVPQTGCKQKETSGSDFLLNTVCTVTLYDGSDPQLIQDTFAMCRGYENLLSRTIAQSDIGKLNAAGGQWVEVDPATAEVVKKGLAYGDLSGGLFDITVGELSELWNFSGDAPSVPEASVLAEAVSHVDYRNVECEAADETKKRFRIRMNDPQAKLDLGGIAKGYIADKAAAYLKEQGAASALLNFGGNVICLGKKADGSNWRVGVERPFSGDETGNKEILGIVEVGEDQAVVTSGTYERQFKENGILYYHILDPKTGYPMETDLDSVTIIGKNSSDCDGLSTTCLMMGREKATKLIESLPDAEAVFVGKDGKITMTGGVKWTAQK